MNKDIKIGLGVTGSIAAYRAVDISRGLIGRGFDVRVLMTRSAQKFIGPVTFEAVCGRPAITDLFAGGFPHIDTAGDINLLLIAPATANIIAKLAAGAADCPITATALAVDCPIVLCPAMNEAMWFSAAVQRNIFRLRELGFEVVGPEQGDLACGESGWGRLSDVGTIVSAVSDRLKAAGELIDRKILVTAGPTREFLDPVRFLSNPSSGKTGYAIAEEAARRGGHTILISGPTGITPSLKLKTIPIVTAKELDAEMDKHFDGVDALVMTAAVGDQRFEKYYSEKLSKSALPDEIRLVKNPDILKRLAGLRNKQILIGFAAQTDRLAFYGQNKLVDKGLDLVVCTKVGSNEGFEQEEIEVVLVDRGGATKLGLISKKSLAVLVVDKLVDLLDTSATP